MITTSANGTKSVYATDLDGDGDADVLSASRLDNKIAWYENQGGGVFGAQQVITTSADGARSVYATDLDGDGDADVLSASRYDDKIAWYENQGGGVFGAQQVITTSADEAWSVYATDLDGDGDADVLSVSNVDDKIAWYENLGGGVFGAQQVIQENSFSSPRAVYAADLDGDGDADVLSASYFSDRIAWYENLGGTFGNPNFNQNVITNSADGANSVYATDLDGDGDVDVLSTSSADYKIAWYENLGGGVFGAQQVLSALAFEQPRSVYATDLDGDGDADVLVASAAFLTSLDDKVAWYENHGGGVFGDQQVITTSADSPTAVYATDLDGDGDADVLSATNVDDKIAWYENLMDPPDCNNNGIPDPEDINSGNSQDCNANGIPDECEISAGTESDCNGNGVLDSCELAAGSASDCNANGVLDECDIAAGTSGDCNANGIPDGCDIASGGEQDCNGDGIPDSCQLAADPSFDLNSNGVFDPCEAIGSTYCSPGIPNSSGAPGSITMLGSDVVFLNNLTISARSLSLNSFGYFIASRTAGSVFPVANSEGRLCVVGNVGRGVGGGILFSGTTGTFLGSINVNAIAQPSGTTPISPGETWYFQAWHRDANPTLTSNFTDAVAVTFL